MYYKIIAGSIMLMDYVDINSNCDCAVMQIYPMNLKLFYYSNIDPYVY